MLDLKSTDQITIMQQENTKGFDGHCLRAAYYFRDQCPEIILDDPQSVNTIKKKYPHLRQES